MATYVATACCHTPHRSHHSYFDFSLWHYSIARTVFHGIIATHTRTLAHTHDCTFRFRHTLMLEVGALPTPNVKTAARMLATCATPVSLSHDHRPHTVITECGVDALYQLDLVLFSHPRVVKRRRADDCLPHNTFGPFTHHAPLDPIFDLASMHRYQKVSPCGCSDCCSARAVGGFDRALMCTRARHSVVVELSRVQSGVRRGRLRARRVLRRRRSVPQQPF